MVFSAMIVCGSAIPITSLEASDASRLLLMNDQNTPVYELRAQILRISVHLRRRESLLILVADRGCNYLLFYVAAGNVTKLYERS